MNNILKGAPQTYIGLIYVACGAIIFLDAIGLIQMRFLVAIGSFFLMWHGFVLMQGPKHLEAMLQRFHRKK